jgi:hypothetical protein
LESGRYPRMTGSPISKSGSAAQPPREYRGGLSLFASNQPCGGSAGIGLGGACGSVDVARRDGDSSCVTAVDAGGLNSNMYKPNRDLGGTSPRPPPLPTERTGAGGLGWARYPCRRDQEPGPEPERCCRRRHRTKSSTMPQSMRRRRSELKTRPTMRPVLSEFREVDAMGALVGVPTLLLLGVPTVDGSCDLSVDVEHGTDEN